MLLKKLIICSLFTFIPIGLIHGRDTLCLKTTIQPEFFLKNDRFAYYEDKIFLNFQVEVNSDSNPAPFVLLSGESTRQHTFFLMLDAVSSSTQMNLFLGRDLQIRKKEVSVDSLFIQQQKLAISLILDMKKDLLRCSFTPGDTLDLNQVGLSVDEGYKFALHLPVIAENQPVQKRIVPAIRDLHIAANREPEKTNTIYWYILIALVDIGIFVLMYCRHRKKRKERRDGFDIQAVTSVSVNRPSLPQKGAIYLFGGMRIYNRQGEDISKRFSPILKELLSLLIVHSGRKGISADKMKAYLWHDKTVASARNNRAVNLGKLRNLLSEVGDFQIKSDDGYWRIDSDDVFVDYLTCRTILKNPGIATRSEIELLCALTREGNLLPEQQYEWLDSLRSLVSDDLFDKFLAFAGTPDDKEPAEIHISIADVMFAFESINEQALSLKCRAYYKSGRHSAAKIFYDKFCEEYRVVYGEEFQVSFPEILKSNLQPVL